MASASKNFSKEELVLLLEKRTTPEWWDKEVHNISFKIVSELIMFSSAVKDTQENCVRRALFGLDNNIVLRAETKIFSIKKKVDKYLKNKNIDPCKIYEGLYCDKPCDFIGNKCYNAALNKVIIDILTGKRDLDFSLKLTNAIVIELYHCMIKNNYTRKLLRDIALKVSNFNKAIDEKVLCK